MIKCKKGEVKTKGEQAQILAEFMSIVHHLKFEEEIPDEVILDRVEMAFLPTDEILGSYWISSRDYSMN